MDTVTLLSLIDNIDTVTEYAEFDVMTSLANVYIKEATLIQGGFKDFIADTDAPITGKDGESLLKKICMFIPRVIAKIVRMIENTIKKLTRNNGIFSKKKSTKKSSIDTKASDKNPVVSEAQPDSESKDVADESDNKSVDADKAEVKVEEESQYNIDFDGEMGDLPKLEGFKSYEDAEMYLKSRNLKCEGSYDAWMKSLGKSPVDKRDRGFAKRTTGSMDLKVWYRIASPKDENGSYCIMPFCNMKMSYDSYQTSSAFQLDSSKEPGECRILFPNYAFHYVFDRLKKLPKLICGGMGQGNTESVIKQLRIYTKRLQEDEDNTNDIAELSICDEYERCWINPDKDDRRAFEEMPRLLKQFKDYLRQTSDMVIKDLKDRGKDVNSDGANDDDYSGILNATNVKQETLHELLQAIPPFLTAASVRMSYINAFVIRLNTVIGMIRKELDPKKQIKK
jgi:hypothetical protein